MKAEQHINGAVQIILIPENELDHLMLLTLYRGAKQGKRIILGGQEQADAPGKIVNVTVSVEA